MYVMIFAIIFVIIAVDQIIKFLVLNTLAIGQTVPLIDGVFHFTYVRNFGAAFSILQNRQEFLIIVTGLVMIVILIYLLKNAKHFDSLAIISLSMIVGGGVGNIIDRVRYGFVVDYLDFRLIHFPVFNFADCCIVVGAIMMLLYVFFMAKENGEKTLKVEPPVSKEIETVENEDEQRPE